MSTVIVGKAEQEEVPVRSEPIETNLYELVAAVSDAIEPGEERLVADVVCRILCRSQVARPEGRSSRSAALLAAA
jgi:hypothetical protein